MLKSIIEFKDVAFSYSSNTKQLPVIKNLNFSLKQGEFLTIIGINGSGKSTIGKIISGLLLNFQGEVKIFDHSLSTKNYQHALTNIGFVFQDPDSQFIGENVLQDLAFNLENLQINPNKMPFLIREIIDEFDLHNILNKAPVSLSGGDKQKVTIASVLIAKPKIIIFDEPTSMLDPKSRSVIFAIIDRLRKDSKITVIEITHDMERIIRSDKVLFLKKGIQNFFGSPKDLLFKHYENFYHDSGLMLPFIFRLSLKLKNAKVLSKFYLEEEDLLQALWKKNN